MADTIIKVENLGKKYIIGHQTEKYYALRDIIMERFNGAVALLTNPVKKSISRLKPCATSLEPSHEEFWALKDISFEVKQGDRVGIIGRNGAGKSTLLKILSRITEPSHGRVSIKGRVASLLEVGTGFHPELTGRENIYLNGAVLGMRRSEIKRKFDEIVAFAEVERFLDTPVKRYSSGMYVRLAFAVAAHLEPEILVVDEVLAVGDIKFRSKCLGKMNDVSRKEGRTVIFVSHDMSSVRQLCNSAFLLEKGNIAAHGDANYITSLYESSARNCNWNIASVDRNQPPDHYHIKRIELRDSSGELRSNFQAGEIMEIHLWSNGFAPQDSFTVEFILYNQDFRKISFGCANPVRNTHYNKNDQHFICKLGPLSLTTGKYHFDFGAKVWGLESWDRWENAIGFEITRCDLFKTGHDVPCGANGDFIINQEWE